MIPADDATAAEPHSGWVFFDRGLVDAASALEALTDEPSAAPTLGQNNTFQMDLSDDVGHQGILAPGIHRALQRGDVTADTGKTELQDRFQNRLPLPPRRFCPVPEFFNSSGVTRQSPFLSFAG